MQLDICTWNFFRTNLTPDDSAFLLPFWSNLENGVHPAVRLDVLGIKCLGMLAMASTWARDCGAGVVGNKLATGVLWGVAHSIFAKIAEGDSGLYDSESIDGYFCSNIFVKFSSSARMKGGNVILGDLLWCSEIFSGFSFDKVIAVVPILVPFDRFAAVSGAVARATVLFGSSFS